MHWQLAWNKEPVAGNEVEWYHNPVIKMNELKPWNLIQITEDLNNLQDVLAVITYLYSLRKIRIIESLF